MKPPRLSLFQTALQVSPTTLAALSDPELNALMADLLKAHAYRCRAELDQVRVNTDTGATDEGADAWTPRAGQPDPWFGDTGTCWQFRAGRSSEPNKLEKANELAKPIPKSALAAGNRYALVASGSTGGLKGERARLAVLAGQAKAMGFPDARLDVFGSERLANWCNLHPAIAAAWSGRPGTVWTLEEWEASDEHQVTWQPSPDALKLVPQLHAQLDPLTGDVLHLHLSGQPGVGKTRFALELCRNAPWRGGVVYVRQASDIRLDELLDGASTDPGVLLTVVADEAQSDDLRPLRDSVGRANGRVRLITIGHGNSPDPARIPQHSIQPLDRDQMEKIVQGWHRAMPPEHIDFVVRFAAGYVRLAKLAADAVDRNPTIDVHGLLSQAHIRDFLDGMLGAGARRGLHVVAVLTSVGWKGERGAEAKAIANHLGIPWDEVVATVDDFHRRLGIVPAGGDERYISPTPLGIHLAVEAWKAYPAQLKSLPEVLKTEDANDAYLARLRAIASNPEAREVAREQLGSFFRLDQFLIESEVKRWAALSAADPPMAAYAILGALKHASVESRLELSGGARRALVWQLVRLAWPTDAFHDAALALAYLAEAENETWANNATAELGARFQIVLGGTAVPYPARLAVVDSLLELNRADMTALAVRALSQAANRHASRMGVAPASDQVPEPEWRPADRNEWQNCVLLALSRLLAIAEAGAAGAQEALTAAVGRFVWLLESPSFREPVVRLMEAIRDQWPDTREPIRASVAEMLRQERSIGTELSADDLMALENVERAFQGSTLHDRLVRLIGRANWHAEERPDLRDIALELVERSENLAAEWAWLTSGSAGDAWWLGEAIANAAGSERLDDLLPQLNGRGPDLRVICGYVSARAKSSGEVWRDSWLTKALQTTRGAVELAVEVNWRCGATERSAGALADLLASSEALPPAVDQLRFGKWADDLSADTLERVVTPLLSGGHAETAAALVLDRLKYKPEEFERWRAIALGLSTNPSMIRGRQMEGYFWKEIAMRLVSTFPREIARAVLREQGRTDSEGWFLEHSEATAVVNECAIHDADAVWEELAAIISDKRKAYRLSIGFPTSLMDRLPRERILAWVSERAEERAPLLALLVPVTFDSDTSWGAELISRFGGNEKVASAAFSHFISGSWTGPASEHWLGLAGSLEAIGRRTQLTALRQWAMKSARSLRDMAEKDRAREEEEDLDRD